MDLTFSTGQTISVPDSVERRCAEYSSGMMDGGELSFLAAVTLEYPWSPGDLVVEIGSFEGATAAFVAQTLLGAGHDNYVVSVDPFERAISSQGNPQGSYEKYLQTMRQRGIEDRCLPMVAFSQDAASAVPERIGLLIIDGNHDYETVACDLALYTPKVLPGGFVFLDDYTESYPGVIQATDEFLGSTSDFTIIHQMYFTILKRH